ncbi:serine/threonine protein kinase [Oscillatoria sp. CS-180]|uniref:serine/threonine-protein kinase n=1 Tax=Oscillatoria sp. CS-180 TaxID=3021720 RepID=UPI0023312CFD|nr:serine/threonine-protein kinase [Oscillatoria sp. CS-180]MDB9524946.1 serine/threonine protein kinase [Oscillatoria sp. CS-180]
MICCLNPHCPHPINRDAATSCRGCGKLLIHLLRGRYRPVKLIGRGGFGRTYLAQDSDRLNAPCVIKQFAPQTQGTKSFVKAVDLFNQEAVRLHDLGEHAQIPALLAYFEQDQYLYLVQQFIDGKTLVQEVLENGPLDEADVRSLLHDILPVLGFIHRHNVIHRDITPTNLIRRNTDRRLFLIDFGIAKQFGEALAPGPGTRIGTEGYAPIEQLRGGQAYPCSDLYSLGATCMHLLTGQRPEHLYDPLQGRWIWRDVLAKQERFVSTELGQVIDRLVMDTIGDRFQTAEAVMAALEDLPLLQGSVPGWVRRHASSTLLSTSTSLKKPVAVSATEAHVPPTTPPTSAPSPSPTASSSSPTASPPQSPASSSIAPAPSGPPSSPPASDTAEWQSVRVLTGHQSWVTTVAFNPRTATLVSGSLDDSIRIWNLQTGNEQVTLQGHPRGVNDVKISAKGQVLVSCGDDGSVKVWNLTAGRLIHTLKGHVRDVTSVAIGHKGWTLASGSKDKTIKLWKLDKGTPIRTLLGSPAAVRAVAMTSNETSLFSGGLDNKVRLWDLKTGDMIRVFSGHFNPINDVAVSRDGLFVVSASKDKTIILWSVATGSIIHTLRGHTQEVKSVAIAPDNRTVISGSSDRTVRIWDARTGQLLHTLTGHSNGVSAIAVHRTGRLIASCSADKTIRVWRYG